MRTFEPGEESAVFYQTGAFRLGYEGEEVVDQNGGDFSEADYSRFKYGDGSVAAYYAECMADDLVANMPHLLEDVYLASSAFKQVPTAAHSVLPPLVTALATRGYVPEGVFRIDRGVVRSGDYSALTHEEREESARKNALSLPEVSATSILDKNVLVIDDILITGTHEESLKRVLGRVGLRAVVFSYVAILSPEIAKEHPQTEYRLNHASIKNLADIIPIVQAANFTLNARTCKFILEAPVGEATEFAAGIPLEKARQILSSMIADGYHKIDGYKEAFDAFATAVGDKREQKHVSEVVRPEPARSLSGVI